jgi:hypothetical protein
VILREPKKRRRGEPAPNRWRVEDRATDEFLGEVYFEFEDRTWRWRKVRQRKWNALGRGSKREDAVAKVIAGRYDE